jgi:hypothetical protein
VRSYRTFSPLLAAETPSGIFSVALSVACALSANPRPLAGVLPYEDRTFLPSGRFPGFSGGCPTAQAQLSMANGVQEYWVLDLKDRRLVVHRALDGANAKFASIESYSEDETVDFAGQAVRVGDLLT